MRGPDGKDLNKVDVAELLERTTASAYSIDVPGVKETAGNVHHLRGIVFGELLSRMNVLSGLKGTTLDLEHNKRNEILIENLRLAGIRETLVRHRSEIFQEIASTPSLPKSPPRNIAQAIGKEKRPDLIDSVNIVGTPDDVERYGPVIRKILDKGVLDDEDLGFLAELSDHPGSVSDSPPVKNKESPGVINSFTGRPIDILITDLDHLGSVQFEKKEELSVSERLETGRVDLLDKISIPELLLIIGFRFWRFVLSLFPDSKGKKKKVTRGIPVKTAKKKR